MGCSEPDRCKERAREGGQANSHGDGGAWEGGLGKSHGSRWTLGDNLGNSRGKGRTQVAGPETGTQILAAWAVSGTLQGTAQVRPQQEVAMRAWGLQMVMRAQGLQAATEAQEIRLRRSAVPKQELWRSAVGPARKTL